ARCGPSGAFERPESCRSRDPASDALELARAALEAAVARARERSSAASEHADSSQAASPLENAHPGPVIVRVRAIRFEAVRESQPTRVLQAWHNAPNDLRCLRRAVFMSRRIRSSVQEDTAVRRRTSLL